MSLPLAFLTLAATLQVTPYVEPPVSGTRLVLFSVPEAKNYAEGPLEQQQVVFYLAEPPSLSEPSAFAPAAPPATLDDDLDPSFDHANCPLHATLRSLGRWLLVLLSMVFVAALLGSVGATRRPLPLAAMAVRHPGRPVPLLERLLVLACLWSPMLMLLGLLQAEREMLSSVLLCMAATGATAAAVMLASRRRLQARLRWALEPRATGAGDDSETLVKAEVEPKRLVTPPGGEGPTPWFRADLLVAAHEPGLPRTDPPTFARVSLDGLIVDDEAARALVRLAMGRPGEQRMTLLGWARRAPADAQAAQPLDRVAPTQARVAASLQGPAVLVAGSPAQLQRRLRAESLLLSGALLGSLSAALLTLFS